MAKPRILIDPLFRKMNLTFTGDDLPRLREVADLIWARDEPMPDEQLELHRDEIDVIVCGYWKHGDVSRFARLRAVLEIGGGFPNPRSLDYTYCFSHGIRVMSCSPAFGPSVAEMALALALACARQVAWTDQAFRNGEPCWEHTRFDTEIGTPFTLYGKQVGFVGFGGLARSLKPLLDPFGCPIQVYDPWLTDAHLRRQGVQPVDIDTLLGTSRLIFVLAVPSAGNRAFLDRAKLERIGSDAVLLLMSRAHVVDFDALSEMLLAGRFRAGIDVFPEEPLPPDHPIRRARHAVLSSHRAGTCAEAIAAIGRIVTNDLIAICQGKVPQEMAIAQPEFIRLREGQ